MSKTRRERYYPTHNHHPSLSLIVDYFGYFLNSIEKVRLSLKRTDFSIQDLQLDIKFLQLKIIQDRTIFQKKNLYLNMITIKQNKTKNYTPFISYP